jgi:hypothetical protein
MNQQDRVDNTVKMVKLFECYEDDMIYTYAENQGEKSDENEGNMVLLREQKNPYWHGKYPLVKFQVKGKPFQFWGEGLFETTYRLQAGYNDVFNHFLDQWNLSENSMLIANERNNINDYVIEPGGVITYRGDQPPQQFKHAQPDHNNFSTILNYMDQAIEGVTISQYAAGNPTSATDQTQGTAHGIADLQKAAGDIVSFMRNNFTQSVTQIGRMWLSNNQQYMTDSVDLVVNNKGQHRSVKVTPKDMRGDMELFVDEASMDPSTLEDRRQAFMVYIQQLEAIQKASMDQASATRYATQPLYIDYASILQDVSEIMGHPNYDKLLLGKKVVEEAMKNVQSPWFMPHEQLKVDLNELYGSEASQYLQKNGVQPDPARNEQVPVAKMDNVVETKRADAMIAKSQETTPEAPAFTPDHIIKIDQQEHQQQMDKLNFAASQVQQTEGQPNPSDQSTLALAQELADQGHIDPGVLAHLQPQQTQQPEKKPGIIKQAVNKMRSQ